MFTQSIHGTNKNHMVYHFKLNDSLSNELSLLLKEKTQNKSKLKVTFNKTDGILRIDKEGNSVNFPFVLQEKQKDSVFEVSYLEKSCNNFTRLGEVYKYLRLGASEDVFSATKAKFVQEEEAFRKHKAKEIVAPRVQLRKRPAASNAIKEIPALAVTKPSSVVATISNRNKSTMGKKSSGKVDLDKKSTSQLDDFVTQFPRITNAKQLQSYRDTFESEYKEYKQLFERLQNQADSIDQFDKKLKTAEINTEEYKNVCMEISKIYHMLRRDNCSVQRPSRCEYLHNRLTHLRERIQEYEDS